MDLLPARRLEIVHVLVAVIGGNGRRCTSRSGEGSRGNLAAGKDVLALVACVGQRLHLVENAGNLSRDGLDVAGVHSAVIGAGGQRNGRGQLSNHTAKGRIGHLQLARHQAGTCRERIILLNLVEQQNILPRGYRILAQRSYTHAARQLRGQLLHAGLRLIERTHQIRDVKRIHPHCIPPLA